MKSYDELTQQCLVFYVCHMMLLTMVLFISNDPFVQLLIFITMFTSTIWLLVRLPPPSE